MILHVRVPLLRQSDSKPLQRDAKASSLQDWLKTSDLRMPTPAARDLQALVEAAADNRRLRKQLEALREAELELAAREAEETALNFSMLVSGRYSACALQHLSTDNVPAQPSACVLCAHAAAWLSGPHAADLAVPWESPS